MIIANCGGIILNSDDFDLVDNIITSKGVIPTGAIKANCGGVQFDSAVFKKANKVITDINANENDIKGEVVAQAGCGGLLMDANYFEINSDGEVAMKTTPVRRVDKFKIAFVNQATSMVVDLSDGWTLSAGTITLANGATTVWTKNFADGVINDDGRADFALDTGINLESGMILTLANATATKGTQTASAGASVDLPYNQLVDVYYGGTVEPEIEVTIA